MIFIVKTISFVKGKGSLNHNNRKFIASNIDEDRIAWNVTYISQSLEEAYRIQFGPAVDEYARTFQERNPNLYLFNAALHMDEATPHLHLDYIPIAHGYKMRKNIRLRRLR